MVVSVGIGLALGLMPALGGLALNMTAVLREEGRSGTSGRGTRLTHRALVIVQVAAAFVLLIGAGLLFASFQQVLAIDPGFNPEHVLTASVSLPASRYEDGDALQRFADDALRALRMLPSVEVVGATTIIPMSGNLNQNVMLPEGLQLEPGASLTAAYSSVVTPGYFESMQVRLIGGRLFDERDATDAVRAIIVDAPLAQLYWPDTNPVGKRMYEPSGIEDPTLTSGDTIWFTVVGVVDEVRLRGLVEGGGDIGAYYTPQAQTPRPNLTFTLRTIQDPTSVATAVQRVLARIDPELPVFNLRTMDERISQALLTRRLSAQLSTLFGFVALFLSALELYGVLAYQVTQRTREIGIRLALGGSRSAIVQLVFTEAIVLLVGGLVVGIVGTLLLVRSLESLLFGVQPSDPVTFVASIAVLAVVAFAASVLPARRAAGTDPMVALTH